jgi:hypothetical protein
MAIGEKTDGGNVRTGISLSIAGQSRERGNAEGFSEN